MGLEHPLPRSYSCDWQLQLHWLPHIWCLHSKNEHLKRQKVKATHFLSGPRNWPNLTSELFLLSSIHRAHIQGQGYRLCFLRSVKKFRDHVLKLSQYKTDIDTFRHKPFNHQWKTYLWG